MGKLGDAAEPVGDGAKTGLRMGGLWECARAKDGGHFGNAPGPRMEAPERKGEAQD